MVALAKSAEPAPNRWGAGPACGHTIRPIIVGPLLPLLLPEPLAVTCLTGRVGAGSLQNRRSASLGLNGLGVESACGCLQNPAPEGRESAEWWQNGSLAFLHPALPGQGPLMDAEKVHVVLHMIGGMGRIKVSEMTVPILH